MSLQLHQPPPTPTPTPTSRVARSWKDGLLGNGVCPAAGSAAAGSFILMCGRRVDYKEKPGWIACTIAAILGTIAIIIEATMNS